jgi:hypothetical protein
MKNKLLALSLFSLFAVAGIISHAQAPGNPWAYGRGPNNWDNTWNSRPAPGRGACFFTQAGFRGNKFCVRSGDRLPSLPGKFGDNISSIQVYGRGAVRVYNDRNFSGGSTTVAESVADLRTYRFRGGHTWNNRISSVVVR